MYVIYYHCDTSFPKKIDGITRQINFACILFKEKSPVSNKNKKIRVEFSSSALRDLWKIKIFFLSNPVTLPFY